MKHADLPLRSGKTTLVGVACATLPLISLVALAVAAAIETTTQARIDLFATSLASKTIVGVEELTVFFREQQALYLQITPPTPDFVLRQPCGIVPFDPKGFPEEFLKGLVESTEHGCPVYTVVIAEDPTTREIVFANATNYEVYAVPPEKDYNPWWWLEKQYPGLSSGRYTSAQIAELQASYDPAHVQITVTLLPADFVDQYAEAAIAAAPSGGGNVPMMRYSGAPVTNLQFTAIETKTNGMLLTLAYPTPDFTNRVDIFTCADLLTAWWDLAVTTNVNTSTNWIEWADTEASNAFVTIRFYAAANADVDSDSDGFCDGREKFMYHTDPTNSLSRPISVSGTISYTGSLTGPVRMIAVTSEHSWIGCMATVSGPGAYTNDKVANGTSYWFKAYRDCNSNKIRELGEPWGVYSASAVLATNNLTGINITLTEDTDEDDDGLLDSWELQYFASIWTQDADDDSDGDSLVNSNEVTYGTNPANADTDHDGLQDGAEVFTYGTSPTNPDTDGDGMGDGAEVIHGNSPTTADNYASLPFTEDFELFKTLGAGAASTNFGYAVGICSNRAIVGAYGITNGSVSIYEWNGTVWQNSATLSAPAGATNFGVSVGITPDWAVVGATKAGGSGRVHVFARGQQGWTNAAVLAAADGVSGDDFGSAVAIQGTNLVIGAMNAQSGKGKGYVFAYNGSTWSQIQCFNPSGLPSKAGFGCSVAIENARIVIGATGMNGGNWLMDWQSGRVYYFEQTGTNWTQQQTIYASDSFYTYGFGNALALAGNTLVVGSSMHDFDTNPWNGINNNYGAAYVFTLVSNQWTVVQRLESPYKETGDQFGNAVAVAGNTVAVGAFQDDSPARADCGAVNFYQYQQTNWSYQAGFPNQLLSDYDYFGGAVAMSQDSVIIGAYGDSDFSSKGSAFLLSASNDVACFADPGLRIDGKRGWTVTPTNSATFSAECSHSGNMSMSLGRAGAKATRLIAACGMTNIWIDCYAKISCLQTPGHPSHPSADEIGPGQPAFFAVNSDAHLVAYDGSGSGAWIIVTNLTVSATSFHRYTVKEDYQNQTWDLYFDGTNVFSNLGFSSASITEFSCFSFTGGWGAMSHVDSISAGTTQPDFN